MLIRDLQLLSWLPLPLGSDTRQTWHHFLPGQDPSRSTFGQWSVRSYASLMGPFERLHVWCTVCSTDTGLDDAPERGGFG